MAPVAPAPAAEIDAPAAAVPASAPEPSFVDLAETLLQLDRDARAAEARRQSDPKIAKAKKALEVAKAAVEELEKPYKEFLDVAATTEAHLREALLRAWPEPDQKTITGAAPGLTLQRKVMQKILVRDDAEALRVLRERDLLAKVVKKVEYAQPALKQAFELGLLTGHTIMDGAPAPIFHLQADTVLAVTIREVA